MTDAGKFDRRDLLWMLLLIAAGALLFLTGISRTALWGSSESRAAEIAREMYVTGDYIVPHVNGRVAMTKPPLFHWMAALSYRFFGIDEFAARLPSALAGMLSLLAVYLLGRRLVDKATGVMAALMTASSIGFMTNAGCSRTDMVYTFFTVAAITAFVHAATSEKMGRTLYCLSAALTGLAFMAKGPAGLFLPLLAGSAYLYISGGRSRLRTVPWLWCVLIFAAIVLPWLIVASLEVPARSRHYFFFGQVLLWASGDDNPGNIKTDFFIGLFFYIPILLVIFFPWSFFVPSAIKVAWKQRRAGRASGTQLMLPLVWFVVGMAVFSLSITKASRYLVPMLPAAALLAAYLWREAAAQARGGPGDGLRGAGGKGLPPSAPVEIERSVWIMAVAVFLLAAAVVAGPRAQGQLKVLTDHFKVDPRDLYMFNMTLDMQAASPMLFRLTGAGLLAAAVGAVVAIRRRMVGLTFGILVAATWGILLLSNFVIMPYVDRDFGVKPFVGEMERLSDGSPVGWTISGPLELPFYAQRYFDQVPKEQVKGYLENDPRALIMVYEDKFDALPADTREYARVIQRAKFKHQVGLILASPDRPADAPQPDPALGANLPARPGNSSPGGEKY